MSIHDWRSYENMHLASRKDLIFDCNNRNYYQIDIPVRVAFAILYDNDFDLTNYTIANYIVFERV